MKIKITKREQNIILAALCLYQDIHYLLDATVDIAEGSGEHKKPSLNRIERLFDKINSP